MMNLIFIMYQTGSHFFFYPHILSFLFFPTVKILAPLVELRRPASTDRAFITWLSPANKFRNWRVYTGIVMNGLEIEFIAKVNKNLTPDYDLVSTDLQNGRSVLYLIVGSASARIFT